MSYLQQLLLIWFHHCKYDSISWAAGTGPGARGASILIIAGSWDLFPAVECASSWVACCVNISWAAWTRPGGSGPSAGPSATSWGNAEASLIELCWLYNWNVWYNIFNFQAIGPRSIFNKQQLISMKPGSAKGHCNSLVCAPEAPELDIWNATTLVRVEQRKTMKNPWSTTTIESGLVFQVLAKQVNSWISHTKCLLLYHQAWVPKLVQIRFCFNSKGASSDPPFHSFLVLRMRWRCMQ